MNYRIAELFNSTSMAASGTETIAIDVQNPISQLIIQQRSTGSVDIPTAHLAACLPKIEIVDGSDVLLSLAAYELDAFDFYHRKVVPLNTNIYLPGSQGIRLYHVNFGRYLWDPELAFDPTKFKNPQLKITYARAAGGAVSSALELQVVAMLFDEKPVTPRGFLMHKEIKRYTLDQGTWEYTDMPTDYPWRMLLISSRADTKHPHRQFREIKLSEDVDRKIPFHFETMNLVKWLQASYPLYVENLLVAVPASSRVNYVTPAYIASFAGSPQINVTYFQFPNHGEGGTLSLEASAPANVSGIVSGFCPHGSVCVPFGLENEPDDWYDVSNINNLKLHIKAHASCVETDLQVCLQQLRLY